MRFAVETLEQLGIEYALVGSLASSTLGEARFTNDIDIVLRLDVFDAARLCDAFPEPEFAYLKSAVIQEVERNGQFNIVHPSTSNKIDFMLVGDSEWSNRQLERRLRRDVLDAGSCYVAAPEDIILGKLLYYREGGSEKHLRDITGILRRSGEIVNEGYITQHAKELGLTDEWQSIVDKLDQAS
ncbi:MAG: hypothetical protein AAGG46_04990 [Planctomycetota bacterium]